MNLVKKVSQLRHPDPHEGHHITWPDRYMHTLRRLGLTPVHLTALYGAGEHRHPLRRALHRRAARQTAGGRPLTLFAHAQLRLMGGGQFVVLARKTREQAPIDRPPMALIEPSTVTVDEQSSDAYGRRLRPILEEAAHGLRAVAPA